MPSQNSRRFASKNCPVASDLIGVLITNRDKGITFTFGDAFWNGIYQVTNFNCRNSISTSKGSRAKLLWFQIVYKGILKADIEREGIQFVNVADLQEIK